MFKATVIFILSTWCQSQAQQAFSSVYDITAASEGKFTDGPGNITGFFPLSAAPWPLFIWMPGTCSRVDGPIPQHMTNEMAKRGFAGVAIQYPSYCGHTKNMTSSRLLGKASAVAGSNPDTAISVMCANPKVDCSKGVIVAGYSQGALLAPLLPKFNAHIKGVLMIEGARPTWPGTYDLCDDSNIGTDVPKTRRRYILGEGDEYFAWPAPWDNASSFPKPSRAAAEANLKLASGYDCGSESDCLQSDGSGYYVLTTASTGGVVPDHFNWAQTSKTSPVPAPWFNTSAAWALPANLDWLARRGNDIGAAVLV